MTDIQIVPFTSEDEVPEFPAVTIYPKVDMDGVILLTSCTDKQVRNDGITLEAIQNALAPLADIDHWKTERDIARRKTVCLGTVHFLKILSDETKDAIPF